MPETQYAACSSQNAAGAPAGRMTSGDDPAFSVDTALPGTDSAVLILGTGGAAVQDLLRLLPAEGRAGVTVRHYDDGDLSACGAGIVILDLTRSSSTGLAACRHFRATAGVNQPWVIGLVSDLGVVGDALESGVNDFLTVPFSSREVVLRLETARRRMSHSLSEAAMRRDEEYRKNTRAQQQVAIVALAQCAMANMDFRVLAEQAILFATQTLEAEFCAVLQLLPESRELLVWDGAGWGPDIVGKRRMGLDYDSVHGSALRHEPVIVRDWSTEERFQRSALEEEHGICSSLAVVIPGTSAPFGLLEVHSAQPRDIDEDALHFLQAVAVILSLAVERRRSEQAIQRLASFAQANPNPIIEISAAGKITYANAAAEEMARSFGRMSVAALLPEGYEEHVRKTLAGIGGASAQRVEMGRRILSWSFFPMSGSGLVYCHGEEVTGQVELESQLRQLQKMECVGQLAAGLAHDFNNILTIIRGHADMLTLGEPLPAKRALSVGKIMGAVDRASSLTRQLLTFSRKQVVQPIPLDLNECLSNVVKMLDRVLGEDIELKFDPARNLPSVRGDAGMLDQIVMNLAVNARDAMPAGGRLLLSTSRVEVDEAYVRRRSEARTGEFVCLNVADTGCGMDHETLSHIFEPFFTTKGIGKGTGLGLATVYGIVRQHEGWIEVVSEVGKGTTFMVFLPIAGTGVTAGSSSTESEEIRGGNETVLLVEDEPALRELGRMILQSHGYTVIEAGSGMEAINLWARERDRVDLLLTDLIMPEGVSGVVLGQKLTKDKPTLRVIYTSGFSSEIVSKEGLPAEFRFLAKPYQAQTLARVVRDALDEPATASSAK